MQYTAWYSHGCSDIEQPYKVWGSRLSRLPAQDDPRYERAFQRLIRGSYNGWRFRSFDGVGEQTGWWRFTKGTHTFRILEEPVIIERQSL